MLGERSEMNAGRSSARHQRANIAAVVFEMRKRQKAFVLYKVLRFSIAIHQIPGFEASDTSD